MQKIFTSLVEGFAMTTLIAVMVVLSFNFVVWIAMAIVFALVFNLLDFVVKLFVLPLTIYQVNSLTGIFIFAVVWLYLSILAYNGNEVDPVSLSVKPKRKPSIVDADN